MSFGLESQPDAKLAPHLALGGGTSNGGRYPNQFFDLAQQYMPQTIKELFRWCTFYFYNSPLIGAAMKKVSRYPITDLIFEDDRQSSRDIWEKILVDTLKIKDRLLEINLDRHVYGNAFISLHLPFTRFLVCKKCRHSAQIRQWDWSFVGASYNFRGTCDRCKHQGEVEVKDIPYKDLSGIRLIRWNPENMTLKFNEYTGRYTYLYTVPVKLKNAIMRGDRDILEDIPLIVIEACKQRRQIRFNPDSIKHLRNPTLAEQDQGWGKPTILHVLKDMYYLYTLRRAQEAIALEHIVPFDIIYPMPNAQVDPYIHTDLSNWRMQVESMIRKHRRDPNFKAVIPIPVGFGRLGGDGKALLLSPELNYVTQTVVGGMGIPQEFLFGGLNFTGSSISLRTLENDFIQNRSELLDLVLWIKQKIRSWASIPDVKGLRFADFRMADDVQRNQQLIGLNAQGKVSDQTLLTELGYDYSQEIKKRIEEIYVSNYLLDLQSKGNARSQGEAQLIQFNYQQKMNELAAEAGQNAQAMLGGAMQPGQAPQPAPGEADPSGGAGGTSEFDQAQALPPAGGAGAVQGAAAADPAAVDQQLDAQVQKWANRLSGLEPTQAKLTIAELKAKIPDLGRKVEAAYQQLMAGAAVGSGGQGGDNAGGTEVNMDPLPEQRAPRRAGFA